MVTKTDLLAAFPETVYLGPGSLGRFLDQFGRPSGPDLLDTVSGWTDLTVEMMHDGPRGDVGGYLIMMPDLMWHHFLPAWMLVVGELGALASGALTALGTTLVPELFNATFDGMDIRVRLSLLDPIQVGVIRRFGEALAADREVASMSGYDIGSGIVAAMDALQRG